MLFKICVHYFQINFITKQPEVPSVMLQVCFDFVKLTWFSLEFKSCDSSPDLWFRTHLTGKVVYKVLSLPIFCEMTAKPWVANTWRDTEHAALNVTMSSQTPRKTKSLIFAVVRNRRGVMMSTGMQRWERNEKCVHRQRAERSQGDKN